MKKFTFITPTNLITKACLHLTFQATIVQSRSNFSHKVFNLYTVCTGISVVNGIDLNHELKS